MKRPRLLFDATAAPRAADSIIEIYGASLPTMKYTQEPFTTETLAEQVQSFIDNAGDRLQDSWIHAPLVAELLKKQSPQTPDKHSLHTLFS